MAAKKDTFDVAKDTVISFACGDNLKIIDKGLSWYQDDDSYATLLYWDTVDRVIAMGEKARVLALDEDQAFVMFFIDEDFQHLYFHKKGVYMTEGIMYDSDPPTFTWDAWSKLVAAILKERPEKKAVVKKASANATKKAKKK
jgi:hypothetical protein